MKTKEEIYDEQIHPLMAQIIEICREHKIANVCSFSLDREEGLCCTTCATKDEFEPPDEFLEAVKILYSDTDAQSPMMLTVRDKNGDVKSMTAIL